MTTKLICNIIQLYLKTYTYCEFKASQLFEEHFFCNGGKPLATNTIIAYVKKTLRLAEKLQLLNQPFFRHFLFRPQLKNL